jgi:hypothetical protein
MSVLKIETYNDNQGTVIETEFIGMIINPIGKSITCQAVDHVSITKQVNGQPLTTTITSKDIITMVADNSYKVPVVNSLNETVYVNNDPMQGVATIGEFDFWRILLFNLHEVSLNNVITGAILKKKGLSSTPLFFPQALLSLL